MSKVIIRRFWGNHEIKYTIDKKDYVRDNDKRSVNFSGRKPCYKLSDEITIPQHKWDIYRRLV